MEWNQPVLTDRLLKCLICGEEFYYTKGEQIYYAERFLADPKRCQGCREKKRALGWNLLERERGRNELK